MGQTVAFLTKNVDLTLANYTSSQIYLVPFNGDSEPQPLNGMGMTSTPPDAQGASANPVFSPDGSQIAYLQMDEIFHESDKSKIYVANSNVEDPAIMVLCEDWDFSPGGLSWTNNGSGLYVHGPDRGNYRLFDPIPLDAGADYSPSNITNRGSVAAISVLPDGNILVSDAKIWSSRDIYIISPTGEMVTDLFRANEVDGELAGLDESVQSEFYFPGNFTDVQAFIVYPEGFDESQTYPLAFIVHGGPQSQHQNSFSTRWNFKVWADQGYVVVAPNPTGSNGFGMEFQNAITNDWGSYPYDDLVKCWNYVKENFAYIDTSRGIEAGASYGGKVIPLSALPWADPSSSTAPRICFPQILIDTMLGYMTNWIQGHDLGREFKALVTHDGTTSTLNQYASEELWFMQYDVSFRLLILISPSRKVLLTDLLQFNGTLWDNRANYARYNPIDYIHNWATPHFVVHNTLDYRLPEAEGIMLFNILQERGVPSKFLNFPDEGHWVLDRENSIVWHREIFKWINYYSGISEEGPY